MTPKEKAFQLFDKYWNKIFELQEVVTGVDEQAKACALISVDEILKIEPMINDLPESETKIIM